MSGLSLQSVTTHGICGMILHIPRKFVAELCRVYIQFTSVWKLSSVSRRLRDLTLMYLSGVRIQLRGIRDRILNTLQIRSSAIKQTSS